MTKKSDRLRALLAAAALTAACSRAPQEPPQAATPDLAPPAASSATVASPLDAPATAYTNDQQAAYLREQAKKLGVARLDKPERQYEDASSAEAAPPPPLSPEEVAARRREIQALSRDFARARRRMEKARGETVELPGKTPRVLPKNEDESRPLEPETPGTEGPEKK